MTASAPGVAVPSALSDREIARRLWGYLRGSRLAYAGAAAMTGGNSAVLLTRPWLLHVLIDDVFGRQDRSLLIPTLLGIAGCGVALGLAAVFGHWFHTLAAEGAMSRMRRDVLLQAQRIPIGDLRGRRTGDIVSHLTADAAVISTGYLHAVSVVFANALRLPGYLVIMFLIDWRLGLITVATLPIHALMATRVRGRTQAAGRRVQDAMGRLSAVMTELVGGARDVKAFNRQRWAGERLDNETRSLWRARLRVALLGSLSRTAHLAYWAALIAIWAFLADAVVAGTVAVGFLVASGQYLLQVGGPIRNVLNDFVQIQVVLGTARRVFGFLDTPRELDEKTGRSLSVSRGEVRVQDVGFSYGEEEVLNQVTFTASPGQKVALVGPSGAGKSTLISLLLKFYEPQAGRIEIDGQDSREASAASVRQSIGVVFQDATLFDGSVTENISLGRETVTSADVRRAALLANADDFITALEDGYDTNIGERGVRLSGGQVQRIAIARAIVGDPRILILDEATSSLDAESEWLVQEGLERASAGRTTLVIAHRLATVRQSDSIVFLDGGRVQDTGRHDELYERNDHYRRLCDLQLLGVEGSRPTAGSEAQEQSGGDN